MIALAHTPCDPGAAVRALNTQTKHVTDISSVYHHHEPKVVVRSIVSVHQKISSSKHTFCEYFFSLSFSILLRSS